MSDTKITMPCGTGKTVLNVQCGNCKWHEDFSGACCNGDSEYRADFTDSDFVCDKWEVQKMSDDLISRQAAIEKLRDAENHAFNSYYKGLLKAHHIIADLPSIQIEQKIGRWIICSDGYYPYCSTCKNELKSRIMTDYCPNCGAFMKG